MEGSPYESLNQQLERLFEVAGPDDITPAAYVGVMYSLEGWKRTRQEPGAKDRGDVWAGELKRFSESAKKFFDHLPTSRWNCFFDSGDSRLVGHRLLPLDSGFALYDRVTLDPRGLYVLNYADMMNVPLDALDYDLPDEKHSDLRQLYVGDTNRNVAISFNQFTDSLLQHNGSINLFPKQA